MQLDIAFRTKGMLAMYHKSCRLIIVLLIFLRSVDGRSAFGSRRRRSRRVQEGYPAFATKKVQFVIKPLTKSGIVDGDVSLIDYRRFAMIALGCELLLQESDQD